jgi:hypothetical protein
MPHLKNLYRFWNRLKIIVSIMIELQQWVLLQDSKKINELKETSDSDTIDPQLLELAQLVSDCNWNAVFDHEIAAPLLNSQLDASNAITAQLTPLSTLQYDIQAYKYALVGAASLGAFVQLNWTGPEFQLHDNCPLAHPTLTNKEIITSLFVEGSDGIYEALRKPELLLFARSILSYPYSVSPKMFSVAWWAARCLIIHQSMVQYYF